MTASTLVSLGLLLALGAFGCNKDRKDEQAAGPGGAKPAPQSVLCLNAASTKDAMQELGDSFRKASGITIKFSPEDSSKLATQIAQGAPADVFLSANEKWAAFVKEKGFAAATKPLLGNALVLITPKGNPAKIAKPQDLVGAEVKHVAVAGPTVPAGIYARAALESLGLWAALEASKRLTPGENVRSTLAFVERGEVEAGIVYSTDAKISDKVEVVSTFDASTHPAIVYPLVLLERGAKNESAKKWFDFLLTKEAGKVFEKYGFTSLAGG
jgi:molybdate transport system substrate-binding protein